jgi:hypothetical protein
LRAPFIGGPLSLDQRSRSDLRDEGADTIGGKNFNPVAPADFGFDHMARTMNARPSTLIFIGITPWAARTFCIVSFHTAVLTQNRKFKRSMGF